MDTFTLPLPVLSRIIRDYLGIISADITRIYWGGIKSLIMATTSGKRVYEEQFNGEWGEVIESEEWGETSGEKKFEVYGEGCEEKIKGSREWGEVERE